ncbi:mucin-12-like [Ornithodoros turicata]|uniref:mucin-12-like n=1 Tax=Ornithodoros turicata TaxID=34597 RepID=UPI003138930E
MSSAGDATIFSDGGHSSNRTHLLLLGISATLAIGICVAAVLVLLAIFRDVNRVQSRRQLKEPQLTGHGTESSVMPSHQTSKSTIVESGTKPNTFATANGKHTISSPANSAGKQALKHYAAEDLELPPIHKPLPKLNNSHMNQSKKPERFKHQFYMRKATHATNIARGLDVGSKKRTLRPGLMPLLKGNPTQKWRFLTSTVPKTTAAFHLRVAMHQPFFRTRRTRKWNLVTGEIPRILATKTTSHIETLPTKRARKWRVVTMRIPRTRSTSTRQTTAMRRVSPTRRWRVVTMRIPRTRCTTTRQSAARRRVTPTRRWRLGTKRIPRTASTTMRYSSSGNSRFRMSPAMTSPETKAHTAKGRERTLRYNRSSTASTVRQSHPWIGGGSVVSSKKPSSRYSRTTQHSSSGHTKLADKAHVSNFTGRRSSTNRNQGVSLHTGEAATGPQSQVVSQHITQTATGLHKGPTLRASKAHNATATHFQTTTPTIASEAINADTARRYPLGRYKTIHISKPRRGTTTQVTGRALATVKKTVHTNPATARTAKRYPRARYKIVVVRKTKPVPLSTSSSTAVTTSRTPPGHPTAEISAHASTLRGTATSDAYSATVGYTTTRHEEKSSTPVSDMRKSPSDQATALADLTVSSARSDRTRYSLFTNLFIDVGINVRQDKRHKRRSTTYSTSDSSATRDGGGESGNRSSHTMTAPDIAKGTSEGSSTNATFPQSDESTSHASHADTYGLLPRTWTTLWNFQDTLETSDALASDETFAINIEYRRPRKFELFPVITPTTIKHSETAKITKGLTADSVSTATENANPRTQGVNGDTPLQKRPRRRTKFKRIGHRFSTKLHHHLRYNEPQPTEPLDNIYHGSNYFLFDDIGSTGSKDGKTADPFEVIPVHDEDSPDYDADDSSDIIHLTETSLVTVPVTVSKTLMSSSRKSITLQPSNKNKLHQTLVSASSETSHSSGKTWTQTTRPASTKNTAASTKPVSSPTAKTQEMTQDFMNYNYNYPDEPPNIHRNPGGLEEEHDRGRGLNEMTESPLPLIIRFD